MSQGLCPGLALTSPLSGSPLVLDGHALRHGDERWPVIDEIPFLRANRRELADQALQALDRGEDETALTLLLADQDGWAPLAAPDPASCRDLIRHRNSLTLRQAMQRLAFGPVAAYFAHRWSDPTFLSGLALVEAHWNAPRHLLEVACGIGHYLRAFAGDAPQITGCDLVFAKLWLARHFVAPDARLVCFDAATRWPVADAAADLLFCHDAFYFMDNKPHVAAEMRRIAGETGCILVGHAHNALVDNHSAGAPLTPADYAASFGTARLYDDAELTRSYIEVRMPVAVAATELRDVAAVALASGEASGEMPRRVEGAIGGVSAGTVLRRNPLYRPAAEGAQVAWPSARYEQEYASLATYPLWTDAPPTAIAGDPAIGELGRRRVYVDLPARW